MHLAASGEMYLETIYVLSRELGEVHSVDISEHMGYSKPSVCRAIGLLKKGGYVKMAENGALTLTPEGREVAGKIFERHTVLSAFLIHLGVDAQTAAEDACKMEHDISDASLEAIKAFVKKNKMI